MARKKTLLAFNPDTMTVRDVKTAVSCLRGIFQDFDRCQAVMEDESAGPEKEAEAAYNLWLAILQVRGAYAVSEEEADG